MAKKVNRRLRELSDAPRDLGTRYIAGEDDEGPILSQLGFLMVSVLVFVLVTAGAAWFGSRQIQSHLAAVATSELAAAGFPDVTVVANGRDIALIGLVPEDTDLEAVAATAQAVNGVRRVTRTDLGFVEVVEDVSGPAAADPLTVVWAGGAAQVSGTLSSDEVLRQVVERLEAAYTTVDTEELVVREGVSSEESWLPGVLDVIDTAASTVDEGQVVVNGDARVVTVTAELPNRQARLDLRSQTEEVLAAGPLDFLNGLTVEDAPPPAPPEVVEELQVNLDELIEGKVVEFALNSDELTSRGEALLDEIVEALRLAPEVAVEIAGHADAQGPDDLNMALSRRRAQAVFEYLVANGEDPGRFQVIGYGETRPIADNDTEEGRSRNRRIEFVALLD